MRKRCKSGLGTVSISGNGRRVVTTEGRDNSAVRMSSPRYRTSPRPSWISHRLGSSDKQFPQRDHRDIQLMNAPYNGSYVSGDPRHHYGNSSSVSIPRLGVDNHTTPLHENTSYFKTSPDGRYLDYSQVVPLNHTESESLIAPDSHYPDRQLIPATHLEPESLTGPTIRFHNPNVIIDNPQDVIPPPEYDHYDYDMPEHSVSRMAALRNVTLERALERENMFASCIGLASAIGASPVRHHDGGPPLEICGNPTPQLVYYPVIESDRMDLCERPQYVYLNEDIEDHRTRASLRSVTQKPKPRKSVFSRMAKVHGSNANIQRNKGNTESDMAVEHFMGELHNDSRSRKEMRNSGKPIARDGDNRNFKRHYALDDDGHASRGSVDHVNGDLGDTMRNPVRFSVGDDDRDTSKRISKRSSVRDDEHDTSRGNPSRATASVEVCEIVKKSSRCLTSPDDAHCSKKRCSGRPSARDECYDTNSILEKPMIKVDNNLANEEAPLVNYKRRSEIGKGQQGSGMRGCVKGFDSEVASVNPGKRRKLVRPSFGSSELTCGKAAVAGGEDNGGRQDELPQGVGWKRETRDCLLERKLDLEMRGNCGGHRKCSSLTEKEVGDAFVTASDGETIKAQWSVQDGVVSAEGLQQIDKEASSKAKPELADGFFEPQGEGNEVDLATEGLTAKNLLLNRQGFSQGTAACDVSLQQASKRGLSIAFEEFKGGYFESDHKGGRRECSSLTEKEVRDAFVAASDGETVKATFPDDVVSTEGLQQTDAEVSSKSKPELTGGFSEPQGKGTFPDGVVSTEGLQQTDAEVSSKSKPELTSEPQGKGNEVDLATEGLIAENPLLSMQGFSQGTTVCDVSLQQASKRGLSTAFEEFNGGYCQSDHKGGHRECSSLTEKEVGDAFVTASDGETVKAQWSFQDRVVNVEGLQQTDAEVSSKAKSELTDGFFEPQGKGNEADLATEGLISENLLLNRQGFSQGTAVCDESLQQASKRGLSIAFEEFDGGYFESDHKGKKVKLCLDGTCETLDKEEQSQESSARDLLQQLAEEPLFCTEAGKVKSEKSEGLTDGKGIFVGFESSMPEFSGATAEGQVSHHSIAPPLVKDETTAKMVDEDFGCEHKDKPSVSSVTTQSELQQRPLRRVKKILKRVKKGTSNPFAEKVFYTCEKVDIS